MVIWGYICKKYRPLSLICTLCETKGMIIMMRKFINYESIQDEPNFWLWFLAMHFLDSWNKQTDQTLFELLWDSYEINEEWCNQFTGYYEGIFEENDGYSDNPTSLQLELSNGVLYVIEFHPGESVFYFGGEEIGCIGPHTKIQKIAWKDFAEYTKLLDNRQKILLLPILAITSREQNELEQLVVNGLNSLRTLEIIKPEDYQEIREGILANCFAR